MSTVILLDTDLLIAHLRGKPAANTWLQAHEVGRLRVSAITHFELHSGVRQARDPDLERRNLARLTARFGIEPFDTDAAQHAADIRQHLESTGNPIGPFDTLLAGHALAKGWSLATHNTREFKRVRGLRVVEWGKG